MRKEELLLTILDFFVLETAESPKLEPNVIILSSNTRR